MHSKSTLVSLVFIAFSLAGCADPPPDRPSHASASAVPTAPPSARRFVPAPPLRDLPLDVEDQPAAPQRAAAWTGAGHLVLFDTESGAILSDAPGGEMGGDVDLVCDPWNSRVVVFEGDSEAQWGEISDYPVSVQGGSAALGARTHEVWIDGIARVAPSPFGTLVLEDSYGPRYRLLSSSGTPTPSVFGPRPMSMEYGLSQAGVFHFEAFTRGIEDDTLDFRSALVLPSGVQPPVVTAGPVLPAAAMESARFASSASGSFVAGALAGDVVISVLGPNGWSPLVTLDLSAQVQRIEDAAVLADGATLVLLVSGNVDIVVARFSASLAVEGTGTFDLPGTAGQSALFFSRRLLVTGTHEWLAATSSGVVALTVSDDCPLSITRSAAFTGDALRGPLAACPDQF